MILRKVVPELKSRCVVNSASDLTLLGNNSIMARTIPRGSALGFLVKFERIVESLMSLVSIIGFASTLFLLFIFLTTPPVTTITETGVGVQGIYTYKVTNIAIQGVPFFWVFTSLISLSAGHTYKSAKHLFMHAKGKHPPPHVADPS
jgi:hypothetical protein